MFLDWLTKGPRSEHWINEQMIDAKQWISIILSLPTLVGHSLATAVPLDQPCHSDILLALASSCERGNRPIVRWSMTGV